MMNIAYRNFPTQYADMLRNKGQRGKSRAFWEYHYDMEVGEFHAVRFYAESWGVTKSTADRWIRDFKDEIDLYHSAWWLKNEQHYTHVKKSMGQMGQSERDIMNPQIHQNIGACDDSAGQMGQSERDKALNLDNNNNGAVLSYYNDPKFNDLFFIYGMNTKFKGKKEDAYEQYKKVDVDHDMLKLAVVHYLHDSSVGEKRYNLTNFLKNDIYVAYMPKRLEIMINDEWLTGTYDDVKRVFTADNGFTGGLSAERLVEKYSKDELRFINQIAKVS